jgi:hypothetical protein
MRLFGHDEVVAKWVGEKIGAVIVPPYTVMAWIDENGVLATGFVFHSYIPGGSIEMALASRGRLTRKMLREVAHYIFEDNAARRITVRTKRKNERACSMLERAGFVKESVCRAYYPDDDAVQFRMLKSNAMRWLQ